jgi:hypothetical protein
MPTVFKENKDGWEKIASRGDFRWHREDKCVTVQWKDCKVVTVISPYCYELQQLHKPAF